jgi:hypothetical protein
METDPVSETSSVQDIRSFRKFGNPVILTKNTLLNFADNSMVYRKLGATA